MNIAIIPARRDSKRLPGKNKRLFLGRSIIEYSIDLAKTLKDCKIIDEVVVTSDDPEILDIADKMGAKTYSRSEQYADDNAPMLFAIREALKKHEDMVFDIYDYVLVIYPCAPLILTTRIEETYDIIKSGGYDGVIPMQSMAEMKEAGNFFWIMRCTVMAGVEQPISPYYYYMPSYEVQDINNLDDWEKAERKYVKLFGGASNAEKRGDVVGSIPATSKMVYGCMGCKHEHETDKLDYTQRLLHELCRSCYSDCDKPTYWEREIK